MLTLNVTAHLYDATTTSKFCKRTVKDKAINMKNICKAIVSHAALSRLSSQSL